MADVLSSSGPLPYTPGTMGERTRSPPQPIPRPAATCDSALAELSPQSVDRPASPALSSYTSELFFDASSEMARSMAGSLEDHSAIFLDEIRRRSKPSSGTISPGTSLKDLPPGLMRSISGSGSTVTSGGVFGIIANSSSSLQAQYWQEVQRRAAAESALRELQSQLDDIWAVLQASSASSVASSAVSAAAGPAAAVAAALKEVAAAAAQQTRACCCSQQPQSDNVELEQRQWQQCSQGTESAAAEAPLPEGDRLAVARLVSGMLGRAAAAADLQQACDKERELLQRRLDQANLMSEAMLKRQQAQHAEPEPWRSQLLNGLLSAGCLALGAAVAVLIVSKTHAGPQ